MEKNRNTDWAKIIAYSISAILVVLICLKLYNHYTSRNTSTLLQHPPTERNLDIVFGTDTAKLTVVTYASYTCGFCRRFFTEVLPRLDSAYIAPGKVRVVLKLVEHSSHPDVLNAAKTAVCISRYGYFEKLHQLLAIDGKVMFSQEFRDMVTEFEERDPIVAECILGNEAEEYLDANRREFDSLQLKGTPTFIIGRTVYRGYRPYRSFVRLIEQHLKRVSAR